MTQHGVALTQSQGRFLCVASSTRRHRSTLGGREAYLPNVHFQAFCAHLSHARAERRAGIKLLTIPWQGLRIVSTYSGKTGNLHRLKKPDVMFQMMPSGWRGEGG